MYPSSPRSIQVAVVGNGRVEDALSGWHGDTVLEVESVAPSAVTDGFDGGGLDPRRTDCVVVGAAEPGEAHTADESVSIEVVERCRRIYDGVVESWLG